ncbi:hypothetical protein LOTGIDRAFT_138311 [Lottia gigantea]|uniref:Uncharacterized protein n=1 Tax=Lottia gigantea TaxID=225164 RepID=V4B4T8_LOTGI|nr:hypothetical protein LOTGIDRAFT_138311 [Lottia gigantea]ESP02496.1 hypothetical protein LOTGIDRAFT_138311 [Lottia gigantea]
MISSLVKDAEKWLITNGLGKSGKSGKSLKKKKPKKTKPMEKQADKKLAPMKTADDVIKRIQWDSDLPQGDFLIGYQDRFEGIKEKYFSAFSWEDIASVDYDELAIPKHRIEYFKYKELKVWDKLSRLDNIFGSVGSGKKITDVIENYETELELQKEKEKETKMDTSPTDDADVGIVVTVATPPTSEYWKDKLRPNYFLAVRITNPEILKVTSGIQDSILNSQSVYKKSFSAPASLHITLCTLGLDTQEHVDSAVKALHSIHEELKVLVPRKSLIVNGVSNFNKRVVYAKVEYPPEFLEFVEHIEMCLRHEGIEFRGQHGGYVPHMTIMKTNRPISRRLGTAHIDPKLYQDYSEQYFGEVPVDAVYLCSMAGQRQPDGFYVSPTHIVF